jgi:hypothetical protein
MDRLLVTLAALAGDELRLELVPGGSEIPAEGYDFAVTASNGARRARITAGDDRGFVYALVELADRLRVEGADAWPNGAEEQHRAAVPIRGIQRAFVSLDEDAGWFYDRQHWTDYLDHIAASRFNRLHLAFGMGYNYGADPSPADDNYLCFAYPFLIDVPGFEVRAQGVDAEERARNLAQLRFVAPRQRDEAWTSNSASGITPGTTGPTP